MGTHAFRWLWMFSVAVSLILSFIVAHLLTAAIFQWNWLKTEILYLTSNGPSLGIWLLFVNTAIQYLHCVGQQRNEKPSESCFKWANSCVAAGAIQRHRAVWPAPCPFLVALAGCKQTERRGGRGTLLGSPSSTRHANYNNNGAWSQVLAGHVSQ